MVSQNVVLYEVSFEELHFLPKDWVIACYSPCYRNFYKVLTAGKIIKNDYLSALVFLSKDNPSDYLRGVTV